MIVLLLIYSFKSHSHPVSCSIRPYCITLCVIMLTLPYTWTLSALWPPLLLVQECISGGSTLASSHSSCCLLGISQKTTEWRCHEVATIYNSMCVENQSQFYAISLPLVYLWSNLLKTAGLRKIIFCDRNWKASQEGKIDAETFIAVLRENLFQSAHIFSWGWGTFQSNNALNNKKTILGLMFSGLWESPGGAKGRNSTWTQKSIKRTSLKRS